MLPLQAGQFRNTADASTRKRQTSTITRRASTYTERRVIQLLSTAQNAVQLVVYTPQLTLRDSFVFDVPFHLPTQISDNNNTEKQTKKGFSEPTDETQHARKLIGFYKPSNFREDAHAGVSVFGSLATEGPFCSSARAAVTAERSVRLRKPHCLAVVIIVVVGTKPQRL